MTYEEAREYISSCFDTSKFDEKTSKAIDKILTITDELHNWLGEHIHEDDCNKEYFEDVLGMEEADAEYFACGDC